MKTNIRSALITVLILGLTAGNVHADDKAWAALGGFVAGVITGSAIDNGDAWDAGVRVSVGNRHPKRGYWETHKVRVWVPGHWEVVINRCGDRIRVWRPGYYDYHIERVWVAYRDHDHGRDRYRDGRYCD